MTATDILSTVRPEDLFPGDPEKAKRRYRELALLWHPDRGGNDAVFAHLTSLYHSALERLSKGLWEGSAVLAFQGLDGSARTFAAHASSPFELGQSIVGDDHVLYLLDSSFVRMAVKPPSFAYASDRMREEISKCLPQQTRIIPLTDGRALVQIDKTPDLLRLRDVVTHLGTLDPKHAAWIVSSLMNLACYLSYAGLVHHDISPDTYFISPKFHSGALLGGWWYVRQRGERVRTLPRRTFNLLPFKVRVTKQASSLTDLELIRATARECLSSPAPEPMRTWLEGVGVGSAVEQYREWAVVLERTFGPRRFVAMSINADAVYGTKGSVNHG